MAEVAAVAIGAAGGGGKQLAREGLAAGVADHEAQLLHVVRRARTCTARHRGTRCAPTGRTAPSS